MASWYGPAMALSAIGDATANAYKGAAEGVERSEVLRDRMANRALLEQQLKLQAQQIGRPQLHSMGQNRVLVQTPQGWTAVDLPAAPLNAYQQQQIATSAANQRRYEAQTAHLGEGAKIP